MADAKTNITDEGDHRGATVTTLVSAHDRGSRDYNQRVGEGDPFGSNGPPAPTPPPATGATAGSPGSWTPAGSTPPADAAAASSITASPTTAWTTGQYVQGSTAGAPGEMTWSGTGWVGGRAP